MGVVVKDLERREEKRQKGYWNHRDFLESDQDFSQINAEILFEHILALI